MDQPFLATAAPKSNKSTYIWVALAIGCCIVISICVVLLIVFWPSSVNLSGHWTGFTSTGAKGGYDWVIAQSGSSLTVDDNNNPTTQSTGTISGSAITMGWGTTGTVSADGKTITWSDGTHWTKNA